MRTRTAENLKLKLSRETLCALDYQPGTGPAEIVVTSTCRSGKPCCH